MSSSKEAEYSEMPTISSASAAIDKADKAEEMAAAQANARRRLSERIRRWNERTLENVGDDIKTTFSLRKADKLEKKAFALENEYNAVVDAHEKLFANRYRYTDEKGLPSYFYKYPTEKLWKNIPSSNILIELFHAAAIEYKNNNNEAKAGEMEKNGGNYFWAKQWGNYDVRPLPPTAVLCPEPLVSEGNTEQGCALQGGSKKSKSKYSRKSKSKSKYSRKSKSKYSRKSKSRYSRKTKSKYSRKYLK